jgi:hypothetical protein
MRHWLKYEYLELEAILEAFQTRHAIEKKLRDSLVKHQSNLQEV